MLTEFHCTLSRVLYLGHDESASCLNLKALQLLLIVTNVPVNSATL